MLDNKSLILIVDDNPVNIQIVGEHLRDGGYDISVATSGIKAVAIAAKSNPDLILLDIMMPDMDGYDVCRQLKANPETQEIPIIFLTAKIDEADIVKGFSLGAVDYVSKPFRSEELMARVATQLNL